MSFPIGTIKPAACSALLLTLLGCAGLHAQEEPAQNNVLVTPAPAPQFAITGFTVLGDKPLSDADIARVLAPFVRPDAGMATLQQATAALEAALHAHGFVLHRVSLPPQEVGATVRLEIVKYVIGTVTVDGNTLFSQANIRASLPELVEGQVPNFHTLAVQTAIANENPAKQVQVGLKESDEPEKIDARVQVREGVPWSLSVSDANTGSPSSGNDRLTVSGSYFNVWNRDHQFTAAYTTSLEQPQAVSQVGLNYRLPVYRWGGVVGASYTSSNVVGNFGSFTSTGTGQTVGLNYNHYLAPVGGYRGYVGLALDDKRFDASQINGVPVVGQVTRRSNPLTLSYNARMEGDTSNWSYSADLAVNVPGSPGNDLASYQAEDPRINSVNWNAVHGSGSYTAQLAGGWSWSVRGQFQYSGYALLSGEQFGIGGVSSVRGTSERPLSADTGAQLSLELTTRELRPGLRLLGFVDAGVLGNNDATGTTKVGSDSLSSVGLGLRYAAAHAVVALDYGYVVSGSTQPLASGVSVPRSGDDKLNVSVTARF